jgi:histidinol phosphatase-like enzyme (inositol monophosphatase family)
MTTGDLPPSSSVSARLDAAIEAARDAGELTLQFFGKDRLSFERKQDNSPVTQADRGAEQLLRSRILKAFPNDTVVGEEFGEVPGTSGFSWILDPIDGTKSFISGVPLYSVLVGILYGKTSVAGVIRIPALDECVYAATKQGAWWIRGSDRPRSARVSSCKSLGEGLFVTSQVDSFAGRGAADVFLQLERAAYITRTWGDGYGYLLVATGRALAMVDPDMKLWDAAAILPVVVEAGGTFTDWCGEPTIEHGEGVATNGHVLEEVLRVTRKHAQRTPS